MVNGSDCLQIQGGGGGDLQLIRGRIQEYDVSCGMITHQFNMFGIVNIWIRGRFYVEIGYFFNFH